MPIDLESIDEIGNPHEKFLDYIRDATTGGKYRSYLKQFLSEIPHNVYQLVSETVKESEEEQASQFVLVAKKDQDLAHVIIAKYIKMQKKRVDKGDLSPNTLPNLIKPIRALLDSNEIALDWKSLYKMYPRPIMTEDRGYTRQEIQTMVEISHDLTDKVILTVFSSAGFRVEAWDYLCWKDVTFFRNEDGTFRGAALLIYREDPKRYHTFITPEACKYLDMYREKWKTDVGKYPAPNDPLLRVTTQITIKQLNAKGVKSRITNLARKAGLRPKLPPGRRRHTVPIDHGFRKYFNTMMGRAKVNYLDKEDMMGHATGLERHYERYVEDFERFPEYQKAIPFLTIDDSARKQLELEKIREEKSKLEKTLIPKDKVRNMIKVEVNKALRESLFESAQVNTP